MPSAAAAKLEKQASTEVVDPIKQAITTLEHKIRNLEKRKRKIESYREEQKNGKELNADQLNAVSKFDEVQYSLEFSRELYKQFQGNAAEAAKQQKKMARKEYQEKVQQELAKVKEILLIQDILQNIGTEAAREDFLAARNGAIQLTDQDLKYLDDIYQEAFPRRGNEEGLPPFMDQVHTAAEHLINIVDGRSKDVVGTNYTHLKELVQSIHGCGYFDQNLEDSSEETTEEASVATAAVPAAATQEEGVEEEDSFMVESQTVLPSEPPSYPQGTVAQVVPAQAGSQSVLPAPASQVAAAAAAPPPAAQAPLVQAQAMASVVPSAVPAVESSFFSTGTTPAFVPPPPNLPQTRALNEVISSVSGSFNFLQDSELDSPDLSVMLAGTPGQPAQHVVATPPPATPVAVTPIASQTFTNQNFASTGVQPKVVFQPPGEMAHHIPGFATATPNPPPPIPMPPSHQVPGAAQRAVPVHQLAAQPAPPAATPLHRPPLTPAAYGAPAPAVSAHGYAAQASQPQPQQQPQSQTQTQQQPQLPQLPPQQPAQAQQKQGPPQQAPQQSQPPQASVQHPKHIQQSLGQAQSCQMQATMQSQSAAVAQPTPASKPVAVQAASQQPKALPPASFAHKQCETAQSGDTPSATAEENLEEWGSNEVTQTGEWGQQTETSSNEWQSTTTDEWGSSSNNQNDGYTTQGNRNYNGGRSRANRGGGRGSANGYPGRGRGNYQNGRGGGGGGGYGYRNDERSNNYYQNGYQRDNFNGGFKRGRVARGGMERGGNNSRGGIDRGGMRAGLVGRAGSRGSRPSNFPRGGGNKQQ